MTTLKRARQGTAYREITWVKTTNTVLISTEDSQEPALLSNYQFQALSQILFNRLVFTAI